MVVLYSEPETYGPCSSANWEDTRWTGVLEKRKLNGKWLIVRRHFSLPPYFEHPGIAQVVFVLNSDVGEETYEAIFRQV